MSLATSERQQVLYHQPCEQHGSKGHDVTKAARYYRGQFVESETVNSCSISVRTELPITLDNYQFINGYELSEICVYDTNRNNEPIVRRQYNVRREPLSDNSYADGILTVKKPKLY